MVLLNRRLLCYAMSAYYRINFLMFIRRNCYAKLMADRYVNFSRIR